ncbi:hypothetical protein KR074_002211 [Drosophila pseudoananassae]|nr:hypothetical protein KR074_002211 [Drosophila pseudoananassae]
MFTAHQNLSLRLLVLSTVVSGSWGFLNSTGCGHRCASGDCIPLDQLCDGTANCQDVSDETKALCQKVWCPGYSFRCSYGACIASSAVCDGIMDCVDGSDEERWLCRAQMQEANCDHWEMHCSSGQCMPYSKLCDGIKDCTDGDDEGGTLCEGVTKSETDPSRINSTQREEGCLVPDLPNVIIKNSKNAVIHAGTRIPNGTSIFYDCPAEHSLKGETDNACRGSMWMKKFPYCETPTAFFFNLTISLFSLLMVILVFLLWRIRRESDTRRRRLREENIWLVETSSSRHIESTLPKY